MKKKILSSLLFVLLSITCIGYSNLNVEAKDLGEDMDFSYLLTEDTLIGVAEFQTKGIYLAEGNSFINKMSSSKIGAGGVTNAAVKCKVSVTAIVERETSSGWARVTSWTQTNENAFSAGVSKSLTVGTGYYYRVRCTHYAESDVSSSWTGALWMGN